MIEAEAALTTEGGVAPASTTGQDLAVAGRNAVTLAFSLMATWTVAILVRFQLPRFLGPAGFGDYNFAETFTASFFQLTTFGVETYIMKEVSIRPKHASDFIGGVFTLRGVIAAVVILPLMAITLAGTHRSTEVQLAVLIFGLTQLVAANNDSFAALLQSSTVVRRLAIANVLSKVVWGIGLAIAIFAQSTLAILAVPLLASELLKAAFLLPAVHAAIGLRFRIDVARTKAVLLASVPYFLSLAASNLGARFIAAMIEFATPNKLEVGYYGASANLASLAMLLSPLFQWVLMPLLARAMARSEDEVFSLTRRALEALLVVIVPVTLLISLGADLQS